MRIKNYLLSVILSLPILMSINISYAETPEVTNGVISLFEHRENPFVKPTSPEEERVRIEEKLKSVVRVMIPEMESTVMRNVAANQAQMEIRVNKNIGDKIDVVSKNLEDKISKAIEENNVTLMSNLPKSGGVIGGDINSKMAPQDQMTKTNPNIPEGSEFIGCVNGKALYHDKNGYKFKIDSSKTEEGSIDPCAH